MSNVYNIWLYFFFFLLCEEVNQRIEKRVATSYHCACVVIIFVGEASAFMYVADAFSVGIFFGYFIVASYISAQFFGYYDHTPSGRNSVSSDKSSLFFLALQTTFFVRCLRSGEQFLWEDRFGAFFRAINCVITYNRSFFHSLNWNRFFSE